MWKALASTSFWYPGPPVLLGDIRNRSTGFILCFCIFLSSFFLKATCVFQLKSTVFGKCQPKLICVLIYQNFFLSSYRFSHASKISLLTVLNLFFYLKLNHYFLFHLACHHQKNLIIMIVMLTLKLSPGKFFYSVPNSLTCLLFP